MIDIARRFSENPLLSPAQLPASHKNLQIACLLNPGVFSFDNKVWLLVRVAERPQQSETVVSFPVLNEHGVTEVMEILVNDKDFIAIDARVIRYKGNDYLTTLSHLRLLSSVDGIHFFEDEAYPPLFGKGSHETFGIEDCRVSQIGKTYYLTYTAVSANGVAVGLRTTTDWKIFLHKGLILPAHNKDCAIFNEIIDGFYYAFHRPSSVDLGGNYIWLMRSPDGIHWGNHSCIVKTRPGAWDGTRVGAGAAPIRTNKGWLAVYHGANAEHQYCLGAFLLDIAEPSRVIARTTLPIMKPSEPYELSGFFGQVVFTNGHILMDDGDTVRTYYGAADEFVCGADFSIKEILSMLEVVS